MTNNRPTSRDVARLAGVSRTTVSYVLNGKDQSIGTDARARVLDAARQLGYQPDESARTLRKGFSNEICLFGIWPFRAQFNYEFASNLQDEVNRLGYNLVIYTSKDMPEEEITSWMAQALARRPVGIIGTPYEISMKHYEMACQMGVKACVLLGVQPSGYAPTASLPVTRASYLVGKHLFERGHRHIGLVVPQNFWQAVAVESRIEGLVQAAKKYAPEQDFHITRLPLDNTLLSAQQAVGKLLSAKDRPTAIYGFNDEYSFQIMKCLLEAGLRIPQDMAVVGTDNTSLCELMHPSLTSVQFDLLGLAHRCVQALHLQIEGQPVPPGLLEEMEPILIPRQSS